MANPVNSFSEQLVTLFREHYSRLFPGDAFILLKTLFTDYATM